MRRVEGRTAPEMYLMKEGKIYYHSKGVRAYLEVRIMGTAGELPAYMKVAMEVEMDCFENAAKGSTLKGVMRVIVALYIGPESHVII